MNREFAATLIHPDTGPNLIDALKLMGKTEEQIKEYAYEACRMGAEALRYMEQLEDDGK